MVTQGTDCYNTCMREIEVKATLKDKQGLLLRAKKMGIVFGPAMTQDDITYETTVPKDDPKWNIFRIRQQDGKSILTMKYKASSRPRDNHERESLIDSPKEVADMLERVGYKAGVRIRKTRQIATYKGLELCVDEVDGLGSFVEVEKLAEDDASVDEVQDALWLLLEQLGVHPRDRIYKAYDTLMRAHLSSSQQP